MTAAKKSELTTEQKKIDNFKSYLKNQLDILIRKTKDHQKKVDKSLDNHQNRLTKIVSTMESIDEMMSLILVAIRQNEYLQAYYPAQHGHPAGKYAGLHPAKLEEKRK